MYEYNVSVPMLPPREERRQNSPMMDNYDMEYWLNSMAEKGWEFVSYGSKHWYNHDIPQEFWVFRREKA